MPWQAPDFHGDNLFIVSGSICTAGERSAAFLRSPGIQAIGPSPDIPCVFVVSTLQSATEVAAGLCQTGLDGVLCGRERLTPALQTLLVEKGYRILDYEAGTILAQGARQMPHVRGRISLLTSGTTGLPKLVDHTWQTLCTANPRHARPARRWILPYQIGTYAWFQIVTLGLFMPGESVVFTSAESVPEIFRQAAEHGADSLSATPTFWRMALLTVPHELLHRAPLANIALGGEIVDQAILDDLASVYPDAKITHVYASTEAGACAAVQDGRSGLPISLFGDNAAGNVSLKVENGRLFVKSSKSASAAVGAPEKWIDTGDLVTIRDDRVYFVGRADNSIINVGGNKAFPADIQSVLLLHPAIAWCRVKAVKSPFVGYLPEADYVLKPGVRAVEEQALIEFCKKRLPEYAIPRFWNQLDSVPFEQSLKSAN